MDTIKKETDEFEEAKKLVNGLSEEKLNRFDKEKLVDISIYLANEIEKAFQEIRKLTEDQKKLISKLDELERSNKPINKYEDYPKHKDYITKLLFILSKSETNMSFEDIVTVFFQLEHDLHEKWRNPNKSISKIISRACQFKVVKREKAYGDNGCYVYALI